MKKIIEHDGRRDHLYLCDCCLKEVYSLLCRRIDGKDWDICDKCYQEEVKENV